MAVAGEQHQRAAVLANSADDAVVHRATFKIAHGFKVNSPAYPPCVNTEGDRTYSLRPLTAAQEVERYNKKLK